MAAPSEESPATRCAYCGEPLGAYEPLVMLREGEIVRTSRAARPDLSCGSCYHQRCYDERQDGAQ